MSIVEKRVFVTSDGKQFDAHEAANQHEVADGLNRAIHDFVTREEGRIKPGYRDVVARSIGEFLKTEAGATAAAHYGVVNGLLVCRCGKTTTGAIGFISCTYCKD